MLIDARETASSTLSSTAGRSISGEEEDDGMADHAEGSCAVVLFEKVDVRYMPFLTWAVEPLDSINENDRGAGLEYSFREHLGGQDGYAYYQKIAGGVWKPIFEPIM